MLLTFFTVDGAETAKVVVYASEKLGLHVTKSAEMAHKRAMQRAGRDNCRPPCGTEVSLCGDCLLCGETAAQSMGCHVRLTHGCASTES